VLRSNVSILGNGSYIVGVDLGSKPVFWINDASNVSLENMTIEGGFKGQGRTDININQGILIDAKRSDIINIELSNLDILNTAGCGIYIRSWKGNNIDHCIIDRVKIRNGNYGILASTINSSSNNVSNEDVGLSSLVIHNCDISTANGAGIQVIRAVDILIDSNYVHGCHYGHGIVVDLSNNIKIRDNKSNYNVGDNNKYYGGWGIVISRECYNFLIKNNECNYNQVGGIDVDLTPSSVPMPSIMDAKQSIVSNNQCSFNQILGVSLNYAKNIQISGNRCSNNKYGIGIYNSSNVDISANNIYENYTGVNINSTNMISNPKILIKNNIITSNTNSGIYWDYQGVSPALIGNQFKNNKIQLRKGGHGK